jgi:hypothetical protein
MRVILLVVVEIAAVFGIARAINEVRAVFDAPSPPPVVLAVARPASEARVAWRLAAKPVRAGEVERALLLQVSRLPAGRAVAKLVPVPKVRSLAWAPAPHAPPAPSRDDDYLPPWERGQAAEARAPGAPPATVRIAVAVQSGDMVRPARYRHRGEAGAYSSKSRHGRRETGYPW